MRSEIDAHDLDLATLEGIRRDLANTPPQRRQLIPLLQRVQSTLSYLPAVAIEMVAQHLNLSPTEVYGVATFYNQFRFAPPGRHPVRVCMGTACHVKGGDIILEHFERKLAIQEGETTPDREFSIDRAACVGCCALAPVALMGDSIHGHMMTGKVEGLILRVQIENERAERERLNEARLNEEGLQGERPKEECLPGGGRQGGGLPGGGLQGGGRQREDLADRLQGKDG